TNLSTIEELQNLENTKSNEKQAYLNIFRDCKKFLLKKILRENWIQFIEHLELNQLQKLASIFLKIGPGHVLDTWLNTQFIKVWELKRTTVSALEKASASLNDLAQQLNEEGTEAALFKRYHAKNIKERFQTLAEDFMDPSKYESLRDELDKEVIEVSD